MKTINAVMVAALAVLGALRGAALEVRTGDAIAFLGDCVMADAESKEVGFGRLVTSGLKAMGVETANLNWGLRNESAFEATYETLPGHLAASAPAFVVVGYGVDDARKKMPFDADGAGNPGFKAALEEIVRQVRADGATPVLMTSALDPEDKPTSAGNAALERRNAAIRAVAAEKGLKCYDLNAEMRAHLARHPATPARRSLTTNGLLLDWRGGMLAAKGLLKTLGASDAQLAQAQAAWDAIPNVASVTIPMSFAEFYRIVENAKRAGAYKEEARLPAVRAWLVAQLESGKPVPDVAIPAPVVLDDTTVRPKFATREYRSGETICLLGDSLTQNAMNHRFGYGHLLKRGLEVWGKTDVKIDHHGRSGSTTCWMRGEAQKPRWDWLFLLAGINDANKDWWYDGVITNWTGSVTALDSFRNPESHRTDGKHADYCANVVDIVRKCKAQGTQVILATTTCNGEVGRRGWLKRHEPSLREHVKYNPMCREIAYAEQVPLIDFWKYWMGGPYLTDDGAVSATEYTGFIETNQLRSCEKLMEDGVLDWNGRKFLTDDNTHLYFQGYRDIARRLLTTMGCPAEKMPEIEKAWWNMPGVYEVRLALTAKTYARIAADAEAVGRPVGAFMHDVILFPSPSCGAIGIR